MECNSQWKVLLCIVSELFALIFIAVEAIDMDPGDLGKLSYTVSNPLFKVQNASSGMATIVVNGWAVLLLI